MTRPGAIRVLRLGILALSLGALTTQVLWSPAFSHDRRYLTLLADLWWQSWLWTALWAGIWWLRLWLAREPTERVLDHSLVYGLLLGAVSLAVASPFLSAYSSHLTHPVLAALVGWTLWPLVARVGDRLSAMGSRLVLVPPWAAPLVAAGVGTLVFFVQSYRRHLWFGSGGKDLGLFHQSVWLLSQFQSPENTVMGMHAFADHLELIDLFAAPLQWLWPDAGALLLFQAALVGSGLWPIFCLARQRLGSPAAGWALAAVYLLGIDLTQAVMFDWNPTTCGAGLIPWVVWFFVTHRPIPFGVALAGLAICKENLVLYGVGLCLALAIGERGRYRRGAMAAAAVLAVVFVVEMKLIFPIFRDEGFRHLRFEDLGSSALEILGQVVKSPLQAFALLLTPGSKVDGLLAPLSTVAFACFLAPRYLLALAPILLERFWSSHANRWWGHHYGAAAGVVALVAAIEGLARLPPWLETRRRAGLFGAAVLTVLVAALLISTTGRFGAGPLWAWRQPYYTTPQDREQAQRVIDAVPKTSSVAAQNHLIPHLSGRHEIYELHRPVRAEYVALDFVQAALPNGAWPFGPSYPQELARELLASGYGVVACEGGAVLLRRGAASMSCAALP